MQLNPQTIKQLRHQFNFTQQQLADACDISLRTIQRVEKEGAASRETTMALCAVLEVRQAELIKLNEDSEAISNHVPTSSINMAFVVVLSSVLSFILGMASVYLLLKTGE